MDKKIIIGIDPDVDKSGVAVVSRGDAVEVACCSLCFTGVVDRVNEVATVARKECISVDVYVEAGWLNRGNWHISPRMTSRKAAEMGRAVGRNHQVGLDLISAISRYASVVVNPTPPLVKTWRGKDGKITHEELTEIVGNLGATMKSRSNQEERDALLLALCHSNLPIRLKHGTRS